jgi:hypothetical protein
VALTLPKSSAPLTTSLASESDIALVAVSNKACVYSNGSTLTLFCAKPIVISQKDTSTSARCCCHANFDVGTGTIAYAWATKQILTVRESRFQCVFEWLGLILGVVVIFDEPTNAGEIPA